MSPSLLLLLLLPALAAGTKCALPFDDFGAAFAARHPSSSFAAGGGAPGAPGAPGGAPARPQVLEALMLPMRDGVRLHTIAVSPLFSSKTQWPAVVDRSPYGAFNTELLADLYLLFDFVAVSQDMRGCCQSEGNFTVWHEDTQDGEDTVRWILAQPWSNGEVYEIGASADGIAAFELAKASDPAVRAALKGQFIIFATAEARRTFFPGAAYRQNLIEGWLSGTVPKQAAGLVANVKQHEAPGPWWDAVEIKGDQFGQVAWPTVMWAGWYDIFLHGNLYSFDGFQKRSAPAVQGKHWLVVDPCGHCQDAAAYFPHNLILGRSLLPVLMGIELFQGKFDATRPAAGMPRLDVGGVPEGVDHVTFYVMSMRTAAKGEGNYWTTLPDWPTPAVTPWFLHGDGSLGPTKPAATNTTDTADTADTTGGRVERRRGHSASTSYTYDPSDATPAIGGNNLLRPLQCGPLDQRPTEARDDVAVFTSAPLAEAVAATGPLDADLFVSTGAGVNDTDFALKLTCVAPDGTSQLIQDGIQRMRWRVSPSQKVAKPMVPGEVYKIRVSLWNTSFVFPKGHRIRVVVSSANAPRFQANPNTGLPLDQDVARVKVARNTVHHSAKYPSAVKLPVVPLSALPEHNILGYADALRASLAKGGTPQEAAVVDKFFDDLVQSIQGM